MADEEIFTVADGKELIQFARDNIEYYLKNSEGIMIPEVLKEKFKGNYGAFVTLNTHNAKGNPLRGCIGYIEPKFALYDVIHKVSISSATEDTRFSSVSIDEMEKNCNREGWTYSGEKNAKRIAPSSSSNRSR